LLLPETEALHCYQLELQAGAPIGICRQSQPVTAEAESYSPCVHEVLHSYLWAVATAAAWPADDHREAITDISTDLQTYDKDRASFGNQQPGHVNIQHTIIQTCHDSHLSCSANFVPATARRYYERLRTTWHFAWSAGLLVSQLTQAAADTTPVWY
jgi:hypothetical protein